MRRILVTSALPYANGAIHIGNLFEHIQTDIWVRFQRMRGHQCIYVCADDAHGTATMLRAEEHGVTPEQWIEAINADHRKDFASFLISHDNYYTTHSPENQHYSTLMYERLRDAGYFFTKEVNQLFDPVRKMFLADRNVRGTCPRCAAVDQPGDNCDNCGATYDATDLIDPVSKLSQATPVIRSSEHHFFDLEKCRGFLTEWLSGDGVQSDATNKLNEWIDAGLRPWDVSRDEPYFGFPIPDAPGKYFYVWMDAPVGYMASFANWCAKHNVDFDEFWEPESQCEVHHFIGKDIINFHCLFWPATLKFSGFRLPTKVHIHGFVTDKGQKMSKSRQQFILASDYIKHFDPDLLRYYFASRMNGTINDVDFNTDDFIARVNSDLVGKLVNIASRLAGFISRHFDSTLGMVQTEHPLWKEAIASADDIATSYETDNYARAVRSIMLLADRVNQYINERQPWVLIRDTSTRPEAHEICTLAIDLFRILVIFLKPIIPGVTQRTEAFLAVPELQWNDIEKPLHRHKISTFSPLLNRIDSKQMDALLAEGDVAEETASDVANHSNISIDQFLDIDLRIARIKSAELVEGADKLLRLGLDVGDSERTVIAGIRSAYQPSDLLDKHVVVVANLEPREMKFGVSEGMVLAAGPGGKDIFLLEPDAGAKPGMRVR